MQTVATPVTGQQEGHVVRTDLVTFGNKNIHGMQKKGLMTINGESKFVKLNAEHLNREWQSPDYSNMSVTDAIVGAFVRHIKQDSGFECAGYELAQFIDGTDSVLGTISENYLAHRQAEKILNNSSNGHSPNTIIDLSQYVDEIYDLYGADANETRLSNMSKIFQTQNMSDEKARHFLIQQAGFDILLSNMDRKDNPSNFTIAYEVGTKEGTPINFDYGRCLPLDWAPSMMDSYDVDAYFEEDVDEMLENLSHSNNALLSYSDRKKSLEFLNAHGFVPFEVDFSGLEDELQSMTDFLYEIDSPNARYADAKCRLLLALLKSSYSTGLAVLK